MGREQLKVLLWAQGPVKPISVVNMMGKFVSQNRKKKVPESAHFGLKFFMCFFQCFEEGLITLSFLQNQERTINISY